MTDREIEELLLQGEFAQSEARRLKKLAELDAQVAAIRDSYLELIDSAVLKLLRHHRKVLTLRLEQPKKGWGKSAFLLISRGSTVLKMPVRKLIELDEALTQEVEREMNEKMIREANAAEYAHQVAKSATQFVVTKVWKQDGSRLVGEPVQWLDLDYRYARTSCPELAIACQDILEGRQHNRKEAFASDLNGLRATPTHAWHPIPHEAWTTKLIWDLTVAERAAISQRLAGMYRQHLAAVEEYFGADSAVAKWLRES